MTVSAVEPHRVALLIESCAKTDCDRQVSAIMCDTFQRIRAEPACHLLIGNQKVDAPSCFMVYEEWSDRDAVERFTATSDYMQNYLASMESHVEHYERSFWTRFV